MSINETLESLRVSYRIAYLDIKDCNPDPETQLNEWLAEALKSKCDEVNAFTLSTVLENRPRARVVLLKGIHKGQLVFYTNYDSDKGHELEQNPNVAMTFLWLPLQRQVRIEGTVKKVEPHLSDEYFLKRPRGSQLGAIASPQSKKVANRSDLERMFQETDLRNTNVEVLQRPETWGGYGITPTYFEFWQGRDNRMHDRIVYEKSNSGWSLGRIAP